MIIHCDHVVAHQYQQTRNTEQEATSNKQQEKNEYTKNKQVAYELRKNK